MHSINYSSIKVKFWHSFKYTIFIFTIVSVASVVAAGEESKVEPEPFTPEQKLGLDYTDGQISDKFESTEKRIRFFNIEEPKPGEGKPPLQPGTEKVFKKYRGIIKSLGDLNTDTKTCNESAMTTAKVCLENTDPGIQSAMSGLGQLAPVVGMMGMQDTCSSFSKVMTMLNGAMGAYRAACGAKKLVTEKECEPASASVKQIREDLKKLAEEDIKKAKEPIGGGAQVSENDLKLLAQIEGKLETISEDMRKEANADTKYTPAYGMKIAGGKGVLLQNAGANVLQVVGTMMSGQNCSKDSSTGSTQADICAAYPNLCAQQSPIPYVDYCVTNPNDITCICSNNMNDPACMVKSTDSGGSGSGSGGNLTPPNDPNFSLGNGDLSSDFNPSNFADGLLDGGNGDGSGGAGADGLSSIPPYGSAAGGGGSGGRGVGNLGTVGNSDSRGGSRGGGGAGGLGAGMGGGPMTGGGNPGGYGSGFNTDISHDGSNNALGAGADGLRKPSGEDLLKAFLPGGDKDPRKAGSADGITGPGGLTIFQKITRGYQRNVRTLIPE